MLHRRKLDWNICVRTRCWQIRNVIRRPVAVVQREKLENVPLGFNSSSGKGSIIAKTLKAVDFTLFLYNSAARLYWPQLPPIHKTSILHFTSGTCVTEVFGCLTINCMACTGNVFPPRTSVARWLCYNRPWRRTSSCSSCINNQTSSGPPPNTGWKGHLMRRPASFLLHICRQENTGFQILFH